MEDSTRTETSHLEKDVNTVEKVCKRRSSIFQTISFDVVDNADAQEIVEDRVCQEEAGNGADVEDRNEVPLQLKNNSGEKEFDLGQYVDSLKEERRQWQNIAKERRNERRKLTEKKASLEKQGRHLDLNILSDEERAFIQARPNYPYTAVQCNQLTSEAARIAALNQLVSKLNTELISHLNKGLNGATKKIIHLLD